VYAVRTLLAPIVIVATAASLGGVKWYASTRDMSARLAFDDTALKETPADVAAALGGPFTPEDAASIQRTARGEVERAFAGLRIRFKDEGRAFWRVLVVPSVDTHAPRWRRAIPAAGAAYSFGILGGGAFISVQTIAAKAVLYAPSGAMRQDVVDAIGRGIGRSAVHEFAHLIAGAASIHSDDENSYEYEAADRASQYYGELKWASAWRVLERQLGSSR
jgi:hypothetical protein